MIGRASPPAAAALPAGRLARASLTRPASLAICLGTVLGSLLWLGPTRSWARSSDTFPYPADVVWTSAVRFVRIDLGFKIKDRDRDAGYVIFDYLDEGKQYPATLEVIRAAAEGAREQCRVQLHIANRPRYYELRLLERLRRKLRDERGEPAQPPPAGGKTPSPKPSPAPAPAPSPAPSPVPPPTLPAPGPIPGQPPALPDGGDGGAYPY